MSAVLAMPRTSPRRQAALEQAAVILAGTAALVLSSKVALPFWPVPITAQTFVVLLLGALLGPLAAATSVLTFLAAGAAGLPVFAGPTGLAGPTGGYLLGFPLSAYVAGALLGRGWDRSAGRTVAALALALVPTFALGVAWLMCFVGPRAAIIFGLLACLPGEAIKLAVASLAVRRLRR